MKKLIYIFIQFLGHYNGVFDYYTRPSEGRVVLSNQVVVGYLECYQWGCGLTYIKCIHTMSSQYFTYWGGGSWYGYQLKRTNLTLSPPYTRRDLSREEYFSMDHKYILSFWRSSSKMSIMYGWFHWSTWIMV